MWAVAIGGAAVVATVVTGVVYCLPCKITMKLGKNRS